MSNKTAFEEQSGTRVPLQATKHTFCFVYCFVFCFFSGSTGPGPRRREESPNISTPHIFVHNYGTINRCVLTNSC
jgi:hypothetical protein